MPIGYVTWSCLNEKPSQKDLSMNRLGLSVAFVSSLVAGCVAADQTDPSTTSSSQDLDVAPSAILLCQPIDGGICPITWSSDFTATRAYWAGDGTTNPAKVMTIFYVPTKADPTTGLPTAYYAWMMAGYDPTCTFNTAGAYTCTPNNQAYRVYEVAAGDVPSFQTMARRNFSIHENQNPTNGVWDGGTGAGYGGSPVHPVGPSGFPGATVLAMRNAMGGFRNVYGNAYNANAAAAGGTGVLAP